MAAQHKMPTVPEHGTVCDIGGTQMSTSILKDLHRLFVEVASGCGGGGQHPTMPDELLYNDEGLAIWADIIFTPQFYQTRDEIRLFEKNSPEIATFIPDGAVMIDLGAGDMRKVNFLLQQLASRGQKTTYLALDISKKSLTSNLADLSPAHDGGSVLMAGLWGDFKAGLDFCERLPSQRVFLSLGSVLFNDPWARAVASLRDWAALMRPGDLILAGMDGHDVSSQKVWDAYHSHPDLFDRFFRNGLAYANELLGEAVFDPEDWDVRAEIERDEKRHRFFLKARREVAVPGGGALREGLELDWFDAHKRNEHDVLKMCAEAGLEVIRSWAIDGSEMRQYLIRLDPAAAASSDESDSAISVSGV
ncbi:hypothetical protein CSOJ01_04386 [Colletotrichum sojae]|uniref:Histidine-specific methyltransferase SAM-dependent domain-containing protein n=1 Tax=Colletotrichum sojae TaxID=2175907 RepID=A0A8H6JJM3_9PEZI|nr:hypothetical protein CSOJ01_04386 [Colletotrichum sojae]